MCGRESLCVNVKGVKGHTLLQFVAVYCSVVQCVAERVCMDVERV